MKIVTIIGARPQFIKAAMISRAIVAHNRREASPPLVEEIIHTGQHYDENMSDSFFKQMQIPEPVVNLHAGTGRQGEMTGRMLARIEQEIMNRNPEWVLVYGDTNSTLAGALAAAKLHVPVAHVEAGLRSFNKHMPEEINRILTDHVSSLLFCPTERAVENLRQEGFSDIVNNGYLIDNVSEISAHHASPLTRHLPLVTNVGDVMYDAVLMFGEVAECKSTILRDLGLSSKEYLLATVHRAENTDDPKSLLNILEAFNKIDEKIIFPVHPRTRKHIKELAWVPASHIALIEPAGYLDMITLEKSARIILTDSGGIQKEAYWLRVPCVTLRNETEWMETVDAGWNLLTGADEKKIIDTVHSFCYPRTHPQLYGDGQTADRIIKILLNYWKG